MREQLMSSTLDSIARGQKWEYLVMTVAAHESLAVQATTPVDPWWLSSVNYFGLVVVMAVSMCLVIGGSITHPREAFLGGLTGGLM